MKYKLRFIFFLRVFMVFIPMLFRKVWNSGNFPPDLKKVGRVIAHLVDRLYPGNIWRVDGKLFWHINVPGFPGTSFKNSLSQEIDSLLTNSTSNKLATVIFAITKKCSLNCEHCFEWEEINKKETLRVNKLYEHLDYFLKFYSPGQMFFSGGEPFLRFRVLKEMINQYSGRSTDFWIITSGRGASKERLTDLKRAGLTGLMVSLDHYNAVEHNKFRGVQNIFEEAINAIRFARDNGLVTALSLCPQKGMVNGAFIDAYLNLAKELGVIFVQIIEPRSIGRYEARDVKLLDRDRLVLEQAYLDYNYQTNYSGYPIISYPDFDRRRFGCQGMKRFAYVDTNGVVNPCPFCKVVDGNKVCASDPQSVPREELTFL